MLIFDNLILSVYNNRKRNNEMEVTMIQHLDETIIRFIYNNMHFKFLNELMICITTLGNLGIIWMVICVILISNKKYRVFGIAGLFALILNAILGEGIIKHLVKRPRPFLTMEDINLLIKAPNGYSFPSGHTSSGVAVMCVLTYYKDKLYKLKPFIIGAWILAILIMFSRLYLTVHYLSDILGGVLLGIISFSVTIYIFNKYILIKVKNDNNL